MTIRVAGTIMAMMVAALLHPAAAAAGPDEYIGDTAIYGGSTAGLDPNVLIILDTSGSMNDDILPGEPYDQAVTYPSSSACGGSPCVANTVYKCTAFGLECGNWTAHVPNVESVTTSCSSSNPYQSLTTVGQWNNSRKRLSTDGGCVNGNGIYATGNRINWREQQPVGGPVAKIQVARDVLGDLIGNTSGARFGMMVFDRNGSAGGEFVEQDVSTATYATTVKDLDGIHTGTTTNRQALQSVVAGTAASGWTPLAESLFESMRYYQGGASAFGNSGGYLDANNKYVSPIFGGCQPNYVVLITDGMSTQDNDGVLRTICTEGDCDGDGFEAAADPDKSYSNSGTDYLDDVAKYMYDTDMSDTFDGVQNVSTYTIGFGLGGSNPGAVKLLKETAANGGGQDFYASSYAGLSAALQQIVGKIFEVDTSFVAPVVPISPENRTYSGKRVYLGFFKPQAGGNWRGNLKKFAFGADSDLIDSLGQSATGADGGFLESARSFWSNAADGGYVDSGGVGEKLLARNDLSPLAVSPRNIYSNLSTDPDLTLAANRLDLAIAPDQLGLAASDTIGRDRVVNFLYGIDAFDEDLDANRSEEREWVLGDILHSRPRIVNYSPYVLDDLAVASDTHHEYICPSSWATDFDNCNKGVIFVGSNDGMLHAFSDCDGEELWAFVPDNVLPFLNKLADSTHSYYLDSSPTVYLYDRSGDGKIGAGPGGASADNGSDDRAILIFGQRRGGGQGSNAVTTASWGGYYALDVTNPASPKFLWKIDRSTPGFEELGETWSEPTLGRVKVTEGSVVVDKVVAFIGAGYDNLNEDGRFGNTQSFGGLDVFPPTSDEGDVTSSGAVAAAALTNTPKGRGVFAFEVAEKDSSGIWQVALSPGLVWSFTPDTTAAIGADDTANRALLGYSIPSNVAVIDSDFDGYTDRLYVGDAGGQIWRLSAHAAAGEKEPLADAHIANWYGNVIFSANPGAEATPTNGRKIFYRPSVVMAEHGLSLFFGTGDRAHPLNRGVEDRIYLVRDRGQRTDEHVGEAELEDLTLDPLHVASPPDPPEVCSATDMSIPCILKRLGTNHGWFVRLDENPGEKILASGLVFSGVGYATTFTSAAITTDPCSPGNLGTSRLYALDFYTGGAAKDFDGSESATATDMIGDTTTGEPSGTSGDPTITKEDRVLVLGAGIASGVVITVDEDGDGKVIIMNDDKFTEEDAAKSETVFPLYWYQK